MSDDERISITIKLSPTQVDEVVRAASASRAPSLSTLIAESLNAPRGDGATVRATNVVASGQARAAGGYLPSETNDQRLSRSLLRGLSILTGFGADGAARGIVELAGDLGMSPSTAHRYALTLVELGLLERCPKTRKYRLPGTAS
jgi:IclR-like helix-turn-helix domain-containing protein